MLLFNFFFAFLVTVDIYTGEAGDFFKRNRSADHFKKGSLHNAAKLVMNQKAGIGWTTGSHTALPVLTTSTGVQAERFTGFIDNTDVAKKLKGLLR